MNSQEQIIYKQFNAALKKEDESIMLNFKEKEELSAYYQLVFDLFTGLLVMRYNSINQNRSIVDNAIKVLETKSNKSSEDFALLALFYSLTLKGQNPLNIHSHIITKTKLFATTALNINKYNVRAHYALAVVHMELNRNTKYKKSIDFLKDAIEIIKSDLDNENEIHWGEDWCYAFLLLFYKRNKETKLYEHYEEEALQLYPTSEYIKSIINF